MNFLYAKWIWLAQLYGVFPVKAPPGYAYLDIAPETEGEGKPAAFGIIDGALDIDVDATANAYPGILRYSILGELEIDSTCLGTGYQAEVAVPDTVTLEIITEMMADAYPARISPATVSELRMITDSIGSPYGYAYSKSDTVFLIENSADSSVYDISTGTIDGTLEIVSQSSVPSVYQSEYFQISGSLEIDTTVSHSVGRAVISSGGAAELGIETYAERVKRTLATLADYANRTLAQMGGSTLEELCYL